MNRVGIPGLIAAAVWLLAGCGAAGETAREAQESVELEPGFLVAAYHPWWTRTAWRTYDAATYDEVYFFAIEIDSTGSIARRNGWPDRWYDMQRSLAAAGVRVTPAVTLFSQQAFEGIFSSDERIGHLEATLVDLLRDSPQAGGLQIDFEIYQPVDPSVRHAFTRFVRELREAMDDIRPQLRLSLYMMAYDESDVFDEVALAESADYLVVQGYDLHSRGEGRTGPVAGLDGWGRRNWRTVVARLVDLGVPRRKIVMSVPYFGYEWPAESPEPGARTRGAGITIGYAPVDSTLIPQAPPPALERTAQHGVRRDSVSGSPYYVYEDTTGWRQGWFEDRESLAAKYQFVREEGLRGVAVFPAAYGDDDLARLLEEAFRSPPSPSASQ